MSLEQHDVATSKPSRESRSFRSSLPYKINVLVHIRQLSPHFHAAAQTGLPSYHSPSASTQAPLQPRTSFSGQFLLLTYNALFTIPMGHFDLTKLVIGKTIKTVANFHFVIQTLTTHDTCECYYTKHWHCCQTCQCYRYTPYFTCIKWIKIKRNKFLRLAKPAYIRMPN